MTCTEDERLNALARVAHDAWCSEGDWDEMDAAARGGWVDVVRAVLAADAPHTSQMTDDS